MSLWRDILRALGRAKPPEPPGPQPRHIGILVIDARGERVPGRRVTVAGRHTETVTVVTGPDGYAEFEVLAPDTISYLVHGDQPRNFVEIVGGQQITHRLPAPPKPVIVAPQLSIVGRQWRDRGALYVPCWVSGLTLLTASDADRDRYLDWSVATGFNGVRVFAGALAWAGQTPAGALERLPGLIDATAARGLALEVTAVTDSATGYDWRAHLRTVAVRVAPHRHVVLEAANEIGHSTQSSDVTAESVASVLRGYPGVWAVGAPIGQDEPTPDGQWPTGQGRYSTVHLNRGRDAWNMARRVREIYAVVEATGKPALNNEPIGADEQDGSVTGRQRSNDLAIFATLGALDAAFPGVGGVHHSQAGLHAQLPGPVHQACADAYVAAHRAVRSVLGTDEARYYNVGHVGSPLVSVDFSRVVRVYCFGVGAKWVAIYVGAQDGSVGEQWAEGWQPVGEVYRATSARDGRSLRVVEIRR